MAFLDNSGDIILDAVLTDTGRLRLAQGDGSFKITKFALGDDEINYGNYDKDHASGSAYYDLEILQTPVLEAFTNNTSNLNSKLMSIARTNLLYMPELQLNLRSVTNKNTEFQPRGSLMFDRSDADGANTVAAGYKNNRFLVAVDANTWTSLNNGSSDNDFNLQGAIQGYETTSSMAGGLVRVDQGLNTTSINPAAGLDSDMVETQYIAELDYRLGRLARPNSHNVVDVNFIDDDNIASYYIAGNMVKNNPNKQTIADALSGSDEQVHAGPRGTSLMFRVRASTELQYSTYLFTQLGSTLTTAEAASQLGLSTTALQSGQGGANSKAYVIDTTVRIVGANTGFRIDIPVRYLKIE